MTSLILAGYAIFCSDLSLIFKEEYSVETVALYVVAVWQLVHSVHLDILEEIYSFHKHAITPKSAKSSIFYRLSTIG